jgi:hypothetical protein
LWAHYQKKVETTEAPQNRKFYRIKARCYWEHPGRTHREHIENLMGTHWELAGNMLGTKEK